MKPTTQKLLMLSTTIALTACAPPKSAVPEPQADSALRNMLGIRSLTGSFTLPPGEDYFAVAVGDYEDGQLTRRTVRLSGTGLPMKNRQFQPQLLWGKVDGKMLVSVSVDGSGGPVEDAFWTNLDGGSMSFSKSQETTQDGWVVLGFGSSRARRDSTSMAGCFNDFSMQLKTSKHVGALLVRAFKTKEECSRANKDVPASVQEPAKVGEP